MFQSTLSGAIMAGDRLRAKPQEKAEDSSSRVSYSWITSMAVQQGSKTWSTWIEATSSQLLSYLKQWNTPIQQLSALAGMNVKPYHLVLLSFLTWRALDITKRLLRSRLHASLAKRRVEVLQQELAQIPKLDPNVVSAELAQKLYKLSATELVAELAAGRVTAVQTLLYYAAMAKESHKRYNCVTNVLFPEALARAQELDKILAETGKPVGPLHGLPVSIKECISVKGTHSTAGVAHFLNQPVSTEDAIMVTVLRQAGAIIYVKSNIPQTMMISDCSNPIYGRSLNPHNTDRTPGGSSGGEGVLVSSGGSPLGLGTDIGGSIRMPAAWCGVYGIKPTEGRFSTHKLSPDIFIGLDSLTATCGPIARNVEDAALFYRVVAASNHAALDLTVPPVLFNQEVYASSKKLKIGYFHHDGHFLPSAANSRAIDVAVNALKEKGHTLVEFKLHGVQRLLHAFFTYLFADGFPHLKSLLANEKIDPCIANTFGALTTPFWLRFVLYNILNAIGWTRLSNMITIWGGSALYEHQMNKHRQTYKKALIERMKAEGLDALICPGPAIPAPLHANAQLMAPGLAATFFWNILKFPAGVVPVTTVTPDDTSKPRLVHDLTDMIANNNDVGSEGLPIPVQIVSYPYHDETVLRVSRELSDLQIHTVDSIRAKLVSSLH